jgi:hypothetical protein
LVYTSVYIFRFSVKSRYAEEKSARGEEEEAVAGMQTATNSQSTLRVARSSLISNHPWPRRSKARGFALRGTWPLAEGSMSRRWGFDRLCHQLRHAASRWPRRTFGKRWLPYCQRKPASAEEGPPSWRPESKIEVKHQNSNIFPCITISN